MNLIILLRTHFFYTRRSQCSNQTVSHDLQHFPCVKGWLISTSFKMFLAAQEFLPTIYLTHSQYLCQGYSQRGSSFPLEACGELSRVPQPEPKDTGSWKQLFCRSYLQRPGSHPEHRDIWSKAQRALANWSVGTLQIYHKLLSATVTLAIAKVEQKRK